MKRRYNAGSTRWLAMLMVFGCGLAAASGKVHQHGTVKLDVAIEGKQLTVLIETPLDNLLGFERSPQNEVQRREAAALLARLRNVHRGAPLIVVTSAANCVLTKAEVNAPVLEASTSAAGKGEHADLDACYQYICDKPGELRELQIGLFDTYARIRQIDVQVVGPNGQSKTTLKRPARTVKLVR